MRCRLQFLAGVPIGVLCLAVPASGQIRTSLNLLPIQHKVTAAESPQTRGSSLSALDLTLPRRSVQFEDPAETLLASWWARPSLGRPVLANVADGRRSFAKPIADEPAAEGPRYPLQIGLRAMHKGQFSICRPRLPGLPPPDKLPRVRSSFTIQPNEAEEDWRIEIFAKQGMTPTATGPRMPTPPKTPVPNRLPRSLTTDSDGLPLPPSPVAPVSELALIGPGANMLLGTAVAALLLLVLSPWGWWRRKPLVPAWIRLHHVLSWALLNLLLAVGLALAIGSGFWWWTILACVAGIDSGASAWAVFGRRMPLGLLRRGLSLGVLLVGMAHTAGGGDPTLPVPFMVPLLAIGVGCLLMILGAVPWRFLCWLEGTGRNARRWSHWDLLGPDPVELLVRFLVRKRWQTRPAEAAFRQSVSFAEYSVRP